MPSGTFGVSVTWPGGTAEIRWSTSDNSGANQSTVTVELWAHTTGFTTFGTGQWVLRIGDDATVSQQVSISGSWVKVASRSRTVTHNADGSLSIQIGVVSGEVIGTSWDATYGLQTVALTNYVRLPAAPGIPTITAIGTSTATASWAASAGPGVDGYWIQVAKDSGFTNLVKDLSVGNVLSYAITGLTPGTQYYVRVRAHNSDGYGSYSAAAAFTTLAGVYVSDGTNWKPAEISISDGVAWQPATLLVSDGTNWKAPA